MLISGLPENAVNSASLTMGGKPKQEAPGVCRASMLSDLIVSSEIRDDRRVPAESVVDADAGNLGLVLVVEEVGAAGHAIDGRAGEGRIVVAMQR